MHDLTEAVATAVFVFVAGFLLWPPRHVYWSAVADVVGPVPTVLAIFGICLAFGLAVGPFTTVAPRNFAVGGLVAYVIGMYLIEATMTTDSPVHLLFYGECCSAWSPAPSRGRCTNCSRPSSIERPITRKDSGEVTGRSLPSTNDTSSIRARTFALSSLDVGG